MIWPAQWRTPTVRLAAWYTLILMFISVFFSVLLYNVLIRQAEIGLRQQAQMFHRRWVPAVSPFDPADDDLLSAQLLDFRERLRASLLLVNGIILLAAGSASYFLAKRTLRPIEDSLEAQRRFTADASHELRTPLTAMRTELEVALRGPRPKPEEYERILHSNLEEVQRLERLSTGLLRLAQNGEQPVPLRPTPLALVIADAVRMTRAAANQKRITVETPTTTSSVSGHHDSLAELLVILLDNAIKYSPPDTTVIITTRSDNGRIVMTIRDHGAGIAAADLPHVFDRFYRVDPSRTKNKADGYGLGLPIARQIVERHRGAIRLDSTPGRGTTVMVSLPAAL